MKRLILFLKQYKIWIVTHIALFVMLSIIAFEPSLLKKIFKYSGYIAVGFLITALSLNPLKTLFPTLKVLKDLNKYRRELGVACFSYAAFHVACYILKKGSIQKALPYMLFHPAIAPAFYLALPILFILAITSNNYSIKKLGFSRWKQIHSKVYIAQVAIFVHMIMVKEVFYAILFFVPLFILQMIKKRRINQKH
ncbi:MAG: hypothetical protein K0Q51_461 [Rickettsiaceae bacterium]|jgi:sulfoxide reductase heme-binding subunit YedZ|nr:hypothetical protein [Rickettsiaceae bacterium]